MLACQCRSLLFSENPAQILRSRHAGALRVCVESFDNFFGHISSDDISHTRSDIARSPDEYR